MSSLLHRPPILHGLVPGFRKDSPSDDGFAFGNALRYDGDNDYVDLDSEISTAVGGLWTWSGWLKPNSFLNYFAGAQVGNNSSLLLLDTTHIRLSIGNQTDSFTVAEMTAGEWIHILVGRIGATTAKLWVNAVESSDGTATVLNNVWTFGRLGTRADNVFEFDGDMDEVAFWKSTAPTQQHATDLYNEGLGAFANKVISNPDVYIRFNESSGTNAADTSGNGNNGTLTNFADPGSAWVAH